MRESKAFLDKKDSAILSETVDRVEKIQ